MEAACCSAESQPFSRQELRLFRVTCRKTQSEHNRSAFEGTATKAAARSRARERAKTAGTCCRNERSRGSDPRPLGLTIGWAIRPHIRGATPCIEGLSKPE